MYFSETSPELDARIKSLVEDKASTNDLSWQDIADIICEEFNISCSRHWLSRHYGQYLVDCVTEYEETSSPLCDDVDEDEDPEDKLLEIKKAKAKLADERIQNNAYVRRLAREETLVEITKEILDKMSNKPLLSPVAISQENFEKEGILLLSDWHYGFDFKNAWNEFNTDIAKQRISALCTEVIRYCVDNDIDKLHVLNLADLIAGRIHLTIRLESRIDVITQIIEISEILAEFLSKLSRCCEIDYYSCVDNHSRLEPDKAQSLDLESLCRITDWYLKTRLKDYNITFHDNTYGEDIITFNVLGHNIIGVHGHYDTKVKLSNLVMMVRQPCDLICTAHMHHFWMDETNGTRVVGNGSLMGTDTYAKNLRLNSPPSQTLVTVTRENVIDSVHIIQL